MTTYRDAGVDIDAGASAVERIRAAVQSTYRPEVIGDALDRLRAVAALLCDDEALLAERQVGRPPERERGQLLLGDADQREPRGEIGADDPYRIRLFAGCGIVAGSDPASELAETKAKLAPMRMALTNE